VGWPASRRRTGIVVALGAGADLRRHPTVVVWCRRFTYAIGAAPLQAPGNG
jgi:hypothetical protein